MTSISFRSGFAALAAATLLLTGCSGTDSPTSTAAPASPSPVGNGVAALGAEEILTRAKDALKEAGSYRMKGREADGSGEVTLDLRVANGDFAGTMSMGPEADIELLSVGGKQYMKPSEAFWTMLDAGEQAKKLVTATGGKWVLVPATDESLSGIFAAANVDEVLRPAGTVVKGTATRIGDQPVIALTDSDDATSQVFIATTGAAYPIKVGTADGDGVTFSEFGAAFDGIKAPAAGDFVERSELVG